MFGIRNATRAVTESADAVTALSNSARDELSDLSDLVKSEVEYLPGLVLVTAAIAVAALLISLVAIARD